MKKRSDEEIIYSLNIEDVQTVALEMIRRELTRKEIGKIEDAIAEKINWYDAIANAIGQNIDAEE